MLTCRNVKGAHGQKDWEPLVSAVLHPPQWRSVPSDFQTLFMSVLRPHSGNHVFSSSPTHVPTINRSLSRPTSTSRWSRSATVIRRWDMLTLPFLATTSQSIRSVSCGGCWLERYSVAERVLFFLQFANVPSEQCLSAKVRNFCTLLKQPSNARNCNRHTTVGT